MTGVCALSCFIYFKCVAQIHVVVCTDMCVFPQRSLRLHDRLRTSIYICYQPPTIACSVIWLAAREAGVPLPKSPAWWEVLDSKLEDIVNIAGHIKSLYYKELPISELPLTIGEVEPYLQRQQQISQAHGDAASRADASQKSDAGGGNAPATSARVSRFS